MINAPRIVVTVTATAGRPDADDIRVRIRRYVDAIERQGGAAVLLDSTSPAREREAAFATSDGLLLSGGGDMDPSRYGQPNRGSVGIQPERDKLEQEAWNAAVARNVPVLGICRGFQVINVLMGGRLLQDVDGHRKDLGTGPPVHHPIRVAPGTRLARILFPRNVGGGVLPVNSFHHQGVRTDDLAPGLVASAWAASRTGDLVEGVEASDTTRFLVGLQCHPERIDSTPPEFERLWSVFVDACRGSARGRAAGRTAEAASTAGRSG